MYHVVEFKKRIGRKKPIGRNLLVRVRRHMKDVDLHKLAKHLGLTPAETDNWVCSAVVETLFRQLDSSYLIYEPTDMPSLKQLTRRLTDEKMCSESPKKYFGPFADEPHYDGVDHCLRFALQLMQDSQSNYHDNSDVPYNLGLQGACEVLAYLCKWHMIRLEEENWLADGMGDFQCSDLATWYTKACD